MTSTPGKLSSCHSCHSCFYSRLGCIVNKKSDYKEALLVTQAFESLIFLTSLPGQLSASPPPDPAPRYAVTAVTAITAASIPRDLALLDSELLNTWAEIILLTDQVQLIHVSLNVGMF